MHCWVDVIEVVFRLNGERPGSAGPLVKVKLVGPTTGGPVILLLHSTIQLAMQGGWSHTLSTDDNSTLQW